MHCRSLAALLAVLMPIAVASCGSGRNQTTQAAGSSSAMGGVADAGGQAPDAGQGSDADASGPARCTAAQEKAIWSALFTEPIELPGLAGGLDLAGGTGNGASGYVNAQTPFTYDPTKESWSGITVPQAEDILCQGTPTQTFPDITNEVGWGENLEVNAIYDPASHLIHQLVLTTGYAGTLSGHDGQGNTWTVALNGQPMTKTSQGGTVTPVMLDWTDASTIVPIVDSLYVAVSGTPPVLPGETCLDTGQCRITNLGASGGEISFVSLGLNIYTATTVGSAAANSTPTVVELSLFKLLPFSLGRTLLKLDAEGPTSITPDVQGLASTDPNYGNTTTCKYTLGMSFGDFNAQCVQPFTQALDGSLAASDNALAEAKLFGGMGHTAEAYEFELTGIVPQFAASSLPADSVIMDGQKPSPSDTAYQLTLDPAMIGTIANDWANNDPGTAAAPGVEDLHGFGLVTLEWANLVQHYLQKAYGVTTELGDPNCLAPNAPSAPAGGAKCSGLEGIVTTAPSSLVTLPQQQVNALGTLALQAGPTFAGAPAGIAMVGGMRPGNWSSMFCTDAGGLHGGAPSGYQHCIGGAAAFQDPSATYFAAMQQAILQSGNFGSTLAQLPQNDLGNPGFYFQQWTLALIKYLQSASNPGATLAQIDSNIADPDELLFEAASTDVESADYVFRDDVDSAMQPPTDLLVTANVSTGAVTQIQFGRYNFRGEKAVYTALTTTPGDLPGAENLYLTNVVGSPLLVSTYGAYECAINLDPCNTSCGATSSCTGLVGPVGPMGTPLLTGYQPAFGASIFNIAAVNTPATPAPFTLDTQGPASSPYAAIASAMITLPIWPNPFDPTAASPGDRTVSALLPYLPQEAGVGFPITIDGSHDKFYDTKKLTLTGETFAAALDVESIDLVEADGGVGMGNAVRAIESSRFLGKVFPCAQADPQTGQPALLAVGMNDSDGVVLDYLAKYPGAVAACEMEIRYSAYGNYADAISSLQWGVRLDFEPGPGGGVVGGAILFDPNVIENLGH